MPYLSTSRQLEESWTCRLWDVKTYVFESWTFNSLDLLKYGITLCATSLQKYTKLNQLLDIAAFESSKCIINPYCKSIIDWLLKILVTLILAHNILFSLHPNCTSHRSTTNNTKYKNMEYTYLLHSPNIYYYLYTTFANIHPYITT